MENQALKFVFENMGDEEELVEHVRNLNMNSQLDDAVTSH